MKKAMIYGLGVSGTGAKELLEKEGYELIIVDDKTTAYLRLDEQGNIPQVDKEVKGIAEFSSNVGEELF